MLRRLALGLLAVLFATAAHAQTGLIPGDNVSTRVAVVGIFNGNVNAAPGVATLAAVQGKSTYICGFQLTGNGATAAQVSDVQVATLIGGVTFHYVYDVPAGATTASPTLTVNFTPCIPASAQNTAITVTLPTAAGNTNASIDVFGYQYSSF